MNEKTALAGEMPEKIDANLLEKMAKERPDEKFLKGSGVLKLTGAIRQLEGELRALHASPAVGDVDMRNLAAKLRTISANSQDNVFIYRAADVLDAMCTEIKQPDVGDVAMPQVGVHCGQATVLEVDAQAALAACNEDLTAALTVNKRLTETKCMEWNIHEHTALRRRIARLESGEEFQERTTALAAKEIEIAALTAERDALRKQVCAAGPVAILSAADVAEIEDALRSTGRHNWLAYALNRRLGKQP